MTFTVYPSVIACIESVSFTKYFLFAQIDLGAVEFFFGLFVFTNVPNRFIMCTILPRPVAQVSREFQNTSVIFSSIVVYSDVSFIFYVDIKMHLCIYAYTYVRFYLPFKYNIFLIFPLNKCSLHKRVDLYKCS